MQTQRWTAGWMIRTLVFLLLGLGCTARAQDADISLTPPSPQDAHPTGEQAASTPVDIITVLDNSGSMRTNDPEFLMGCIPPV